MTDAEHPIDMLDEAPEGDAVEQRQAPADPGTTSGDAAPSAAANPADAQEQQHGDTAADS